MMIKVIGKENCGACMMAKKVLTRKGIEFEYVHLDALDEEERAEGDTRSYDKKEDLLPECVMPMHPYR